jgi:hypothetical protein
MKLNEAEQLQKQFPTAWNVMMDRLWEMDHGLLIELLIANMSVGDCLVVIREIHKDINESREEENINGTKH